MSPGCDIDRDIGVSDYLWRGGCPRWTAKRSQTVTTVYLEEMYWQICDCFAPAGGKPPRHRLINTTRQLQRHAQPAFTQILQADLTAMAMRNISRNPQP